MNERIKKLHDQAFAETTDYYATIQKFAELLIKESIGVVNKRYMGDNNREDFEVRRCVEDLKNHFGVEL